VKNSDQKLNRRLFLAVWPSGHAGERISDLVKQADWPSGAQLVAPERWHVTLHFIGNVPTARLGDIARGLQVPFDSFFLTLNRLVSWGDLTVLEPNAISAPLIALHLKLAQALHRLELPVESRPFRPHLTLARNRRSNSPPKSSSVTVEQTIAPIRWKVKGYALVQSIPGNHAHYESLCSYHAQGLR